MKHFALVFALLVTAMNLWAVQPIESRELWDLQFDINIDAGTGTTSNTGAGTDGFFVYTTQLSTDEIAKWQLDGTYVESFTIPGAVGIRDLAYDGMYFYGSDGTNHIWKLNFYSQSIVSTIETPGPCRAIAYDEQADGFWINNWDSDMLLVDRDGDILDVIEDPPSMYGAAYDPYSEGGPFLWFFRYDSMSTFLLEKCTLDGVSTGVMIDPEDVFGEGIVGGLFIHNYLFPGVATLGGVWQGQEHDHLFGFELCESSPSDSPCEPTDFTITPDMTGELHAELNWTNPTTTFEGAPLTDLDEIRIYRDGLLRHTIANPVIGEEASWNADTFSHGGAYTYGVRGYNDDGESLMNTVTVWLGEDYPAPVNDLTLTNEDGDALLTWTNPTTGLHGGAFNKPVQGYVVERSDGATFNLPYRDTCFKDGSVTEAELYSYSVVAYNSEGEGGVATSNEMWIGHTVSVTIGEDSLLCNSLPLAYNHNNSLSETIYMADELAAGGVTNGTLTHIIYYCNFYDSILGKPVNIWMGETDLMQVPGEWIPAGDLTHVFEGTVNITRGEHEVVFTLGQPYIYNGGNLVVMVQNPMDDLSYSYYDFFYCTSTPEYPLRSAMNHFNNTVIDPYAPPGTHWAGDRAPNVTLVFEDTPLATVSDVTIDVTNSGDVVLTWEPVSQVVNGSPAQPDGYRIYCCDTLAADGGKFSLLAVTRDTTFTHVNAGVLHERMFYRVVAYTND